MTNEKMTTAINRLYKETVEIVDTWTELVDVNASVKRFMRKFGIGTKLKTFKGERGAVAKTRQLLQKKLMTDEHLDVPSFQRDLKNEVQKFRKGEPNISDADIERVARTEIKALKIAEKLLRWKGLGFTEVRHKTFIAENSGEKDLDFNGKVFKIDHLINNADDRVPLHPNCRCNYFLVR